MEHPVNSLFAQLRSKTRAVSHRIRHGIRWRWNSAKEYISSGSAQLRICLPLIPGARVHSLSAPLIVSLTSYPPRFSTLAPTLRSLLRQTIKADRTILWIAHGDFDLLPRDVLKLQSRGLEIRRTEDIRSYTKILPALDAFPETFICTADDDVYYWSTWLEELLDGYNGNSHTVRCHRAHEMTFDTNGALRPYTNWIMETKGRSESEHIFPTGVAGILYPPGILSHSKEDRDAAFTLCPFADDVWLFWIGKRNGARYQLAGNGRQLFNWPRSQENGLWSENEKGRNDTQIARMVERYGFPKALNDNSGQPAASKPEMENYI